MNVDPIVKQVTVPIGADAAFDLFTSRIQEWWPLHRNTVSAMQGQRSRSLTMGKALGDHLVEVDHDGTEHDWGVIEEWKPGRSFALCWHPGQTAEKQTRLRVTFEDRGGETLLTLSHSGWESLAAEDAQRRSGYDDGWNGVLDAYRSAA